MKSFKTIDEQIEILQSRGLVFQDLEKDKKYLLYSNYYNLINYYGKFFMDRTDHFPENTYFESIKYLYLFDRDLKNEIFQATLDIEKNFRSLIAYHYAEEFREKYSYLNVQNYSCSQIDAVKCISSLANTLSHYQNIHKDNAIKHYANNHGDVPIWIIINFLTFGQMNRLYSSMKASVQNKIVKRISDDYSSTYSVSSIRLDAIHIQKMLNNVQELRNVSAHNNMLLKFRCRESPKYIPTLFQPFKKLASQPRQSVFDNLVYFKLFLSKPSYEIFSKSVRKNFNRLKKRISQQDYLRVLQSLGFPEDYV